MKLYRASSKHFTPIPKRVFGSEKLEKHLEDWLKDNPHLFGDDLLLIGRQVKTDYGIIDLLAIDSAGRTVVIELKRGRATREVIAQLNSYLTIMHRWSDRDLERNANLIPFDKESSNLIRRYKEHFHRTSAPELNTTQIGVVIAEEFEEDFVPQIGGLRFESRVLQFSHFSDGAEEFLLIRPLHNSTDATEESEADEESQADRVSAPIKASFTSLLHKVVALTEPGLQAKNGWRVHESRKFVQGVFSRWKRNWEGISLYYDDSEDKLYLHTNSTPEHNRILSSLLHTDRNLIESQLGTNLVWNGDSRETIGEWLEPDPDHIAKRVLSYARVLGPYLDRALPGRSEKSGLGIRDLQLEFWSGFYEFAKRKGTRLKIPKPKDKGWVTINLAGYPLVGIASQNRISTYVAIKGVQRKRIFDALLAERTSIEKDYGSSLIWDAKPDKKESQAIDHSKARLLDRASWASTYEWMLDSLERLHSAFGHRLTVLRQ